jgi:lipopolysaccharide export system protein LptC
MISSEKPWQVSANHAVSNELSEQLELKGDVKIKLSPKASQPDMTLTMPELKVDFTTQTAFTDSQVELNNGIFRQTAKGMNADLRASTIEFKSQVVSEEL